MARAYQDTQTDGPTSIEVVWQRRPRVRQIPVQFITSPPSPVEPARIAAAELTWRPRHDPVDEPEQS